jgi:Tfp pilus assembly protein PilW
MKPKVSLRKLPPNATTGHTLIELLVAIFMTAVVLAMLTSLVRTSVTVKDLGGLETEAAQGLRGLVSMVTQELRQAGACLSTGIGPFIALTGVDNGSQDTLTLRIGKVSPVTMQCAVATVQVLAAVGATTIAVDDASKFETGSRLYIKESNATGTYYGVLTVDPVANTLTLAQPLVNALPVGAGVYAIEERTYSIATIRGHPTLTVSIDSGTAWPLVQGVEVFDVLYYLGPCSLNSNGTLNCASAVPAPTPGAPEWNRVKVVGIRAAVRSHKADKQHGVIHQVTTDQAGAVNGYVMIKPRNLL